MNIISFGEILLRFSPDANGSWMHASNMPVYIGGSELNVAIALASWKLPVTYCTALPDNPLSQQLHSYLQLKGINDNHIHHGGYRIGTYYMPQGSDLKHATVVYDRAHSAFSQLKPGMIDWDKILHNASWFHFSAITPALNESVADVCKEALDIAIKKDIIISVDLNHRAKLWQWGKQPNEVMPQLAEYCHVIMGNLWSAESLLNIPVDKDIHTKGSRNDYLSHASQTAHSIMSRYKQCKTVAQTFRFDNGNGIRYYGAIDTKDAQYISPELCGDNIIDKAGSGDCFMAGLIYGLQQKYPLQKTVDFAAAAAFGKLHEKGDSTKQTITDIEHTLTTSACH